jgi:hypothetical protein
MAKDRFTGLVKESLKTKHLLLDKCLLDYIISLLMLYRHNDWPESC